METNRETETVRNTGVEEIVQARCLVCLHETTDEVELELWNGYGDCPACQSQNSRWWLDSGRVTDVLTLTNGSMIRRPVLDDPFIRH